MRLRGVSPAGAAPVVLAAEHRPRAARSGRGFFTAQLRQWPSGFTAPPKSLQPPHSLYFPASNWAQLLQCFPARVDFSVYWRLRRI